VKADVFLVSPYRRGELRLGKQIQIVANFSYVYILQNEIDGERFYTAHNAGRALHTAKWKPWRLKAYVALRDRVRAAGF